MVEFTVEKGLRPLVPAGSRSALGLLGSDLPDWIPRMGFRQCWYHLKGYWVLRSSDGVRWSGARPSGKLSERRDWREPSRGESAEPESLVYGACLCPLLGSSEEQVPPSWSPR